LKTRELKKHVGAIHVCSHLTLLQRKIANILLFNAYDQLPTRETHEIRLKELAVIAGYDSHDVRLLKEALRKLATTRLEWNILEDGEERWGTSSFIAEAEIIQGKGLCQYSYSPELRKKLFNHEIYARINLSIQRKFLSTYSLVLYETCLRYKNVGSTGWIPLSEWRCLFGLKAGQYQVFSDLSKRVLKPAVKEVNEASDLWVKAETKREKRRIAALRFSVHENPQHTLDRPMNLADNPLLKRLLDFGVSKMVAVSLLADYDPERITGNLNYVEEAFKAGQPIKNLGAFAVKAIQDDYRPKKTPWERDQEAAAARKTQEAEREAQRAACAAAREQEQTRRVREAFDNLSDEAHQALLHQFEARFQDNAFLLKEYQKKGLASPLVRANLLQLFRERWQPEIPTPGTG
jgi:hypothetical protein